MGSSLRRLPRRKRRGISAVAIASKQWPGWPPRNRSGPAPVAANPSSPGSAPPRDKLLMCSASSAVTPVATATGAEVASCSAFAGSRARPIVVEVRKARHLVPLRPARNADGQEGGHHRPVESRRHRIEDDVVSHGSITVPHRLRSNAGGRIRTHGFGGLARRVDRYSTPTLLLYGKP